MGQLLFQDITAAYQITRFAGHRLIKTKGGCVRPVSARQTWRQLQQWSLHYEVPVQSFRDLQTPIPCSPRCLPKWKSRTCCRAPVAASNHNLDALKEMQQPSRSTTSRSIDYGRACMGRGQPGVVPSFSRPGIKAHSLDPAHGNQPQMKREAVPGGTTSSTRRNLQGLKNRACQSNLVWDEWFTATQRHDGSTQAAPRSSSVRNLKQVSL